MSDGPWVARWKYLTDVLSLYRWRPTANSPSPKRRMSAIAGVGRDVVFALRRLRASPGYTLFAVASLAVGIGVTTAIYSAVRTFMWTPLGVPHQHDVVAVVPGQNESMSWQEFTALQREQTSFQNVAALSRVRTALTGAGEPQTVEGEAISGAFFQTLQLQPRLGRLIAPADQASGARVVVLSQAFWNSAFASDPSVIGRTVRLGGDGFDVIGVVAGDFHGLDPSILQDSIWIPLSAVSTHMGGLGADWNTIKTEGSPTVSVWGRLKSEVTPGRAAAEVQVLGRRLESAYRTGARTGAPNNWQLRAIGAPIGVQSFTDTIVGAILTAIATLLLIACTNLANLALARGTARAQEIAVRSALGANRWRLVREQLVEGGIVIACGGVFALTILHELLAYWTGDVPIMLGLMIPFRPQIDASVLAASMAAMLIAVLVLAVWPAVQSTRSDVRTALGAGHAATPPKWRLHRAIIAWQVCGSVSLLLVALLCAKILMNMGSTTGRHDNLAVAEIDFAANGKSEAQMRDLTTRILDEARGQGGVRAVAASDGLPFGIRPSGDALLVTTPDHAADLDLKGAWTRAPVIAATPQFLSTADIRLVQGRAFTDQDDAAAPRVAIVTEELARRTFRTTNVVGRQLATRTATPSDGRVAADVSALTIVGVSADDEPWDNGQRKPLIFLPFAQRYVPFLPITVIARAADPRAGVAALRASVRRVDRDLSISSAGTSAVLLYGFYLLRVIAMMAAALGVLGLVLAMSGLFGVLSHVVMKRTREMGIRLAIGAERADIFRLVLRDGLYPVGRGLVLGLGIGFASRIMVKAFVVTNVSAVDPWPLVLLPIPFVIAALAACYFPAARASRVDPNIALREL
jgi:putative ABC transport system permease protein